LRLKIIGLASKFVDGGIGIIEMGSAHGTTPVAATTVRSEQIDAV